MAWRSMIWMKFRMFAHRRLGRRRWWWYLVFRFSLGLWLLWLRLLRLLLRGRRLVMIEMWRYESPEVPLGKKWNALNVRKYTNYVQSPCLCLSACFPSQASGLLAFLVSNDIHPYPPVSSSTCLISAAKGTEKARLWPEETNFGGVSVHWVRTHSTIEKK